MENEKDAACKPILTGVLTKILKEMRSLSDCESVAIRLQKDGDYPYYVYEGFTGFFISKENSLCVRDSEGRVALEEDGTPYLACMCGNILKGRFDPRFPFFTEEGCFWTNSTTRLLATPVVEERKLLSKIRGTCCKSGYESIALIPIQAEGRILGLIQLNDPRENMFTLEAIKRYKLIADKVGTVVLNALEISDGISLIEDMINKYRASNEKDLSAQP